MTKSTSPNADEIKTKAKAAAEDLGANARETAQGAASAVREEATRRAEETKSGVANEVADVASALRKAADDMRDGSPQERTFGQIASSLADVSDSIRGKDLGEMANEISGFAKRNPMLFLGGIALAGFAATRFATASARRDDAANASSNAPGHDAPDHQYQSASDIYSNRHQTPTTPGGTS